MVNPVKPNAPKLINNDTLGVAEVTSATLIIKTADTKNTTYHSKAGEQTKSVEGEDKHNRTEYANDGGEAYIIKFIN